MENQVKNKLSGGEPQKMTLKCYYKKLPKSESPRSEFVKNISRKCAVTEATVRNWVLYGKRPQDDSHIAYLSKITGIREEDLW